MFSQIQFVVPLSGTVQIHISEWSVSTTMESVCRYERIQQRREVSFWGVELSWSGNQNLGATGISLGLHAFPNLVAEETEDEGLVPDYGVDLVTVMFPSQNIIK